MNERQAKRLRKAQRAYVLEKKPGLEKGPRAVEAAHRLAGIVRRLWCGFTHKQRGWASRMLRTAATGVYNLGDVVGRLV